MTQQSESTTSTTTSTTTPTTTPTTTTEDIDDPASTSPFARPLAPHPFAPPPLTEPRPLGERRCWPRSFADRLTTPLPGLKAFARFAREGSVRPGADGLADIARLPYEPAPLPRVDARTVAVSWAGHASWVVRVGGLTVLTDPVWSRRILGTPARITPVGLGWDALPRVDAVVISHNHYDHLDAPTLARLPRDTPVLVPAGLGRWFRRRRFGRVTELDWWEAAELDGVRFDFVPAHHWSKRTLTDTCRSLWGGWVLTAPDGKRLYFAERHRLRSLVLPHRPPLPRHRPRPAADRRLRPPLVAQRRPLRPGGSGPRLPGPGRPPHGPHALGHVRPVGGTGPGTPGAGEVGVDGGGPAPGEPVGPACGRVTGTALTQLWSTRAT